MTRIPETREDDAKHTPGTWTVGRRNGQVAIRGEATECVAILPHAAADGYGVTNIEELKANAARIVRAVNSHDGLLAALKALVECYGGHVGPGYAGAPGSLAPVDEQESPEIAVAMHAIAKAEAAEMASEINSEASTARDAHEAFVDDVMWHVLTIETVRLIKAKAAEIALLCEPLDVPSAAAIEKAEGRS